MQCKHTLIVFLILCWWLEPSWAKQYSLNVPRVLLPFVPSSGVKSNFSLNSPQGCFTWTSTKPGIATVEAFYETQSGRGAGGCSRQAILTAQSTQATKLSTIIIAHEQTTGLELRCDVFVDTIDHIEITTRTRELLLEEEPERFELQAFDEEGNMFSTVRGHEFSWTLLPDEEAVQQQPEPENILNFMPFEESTYSTDPIIRDLENRGRQGDTVLVAGVSTGTAKVQVRLVDRTWKHVKPDIVKLLVIENLMLQPSMDVYILPLSFVDYRVERRKQGRTEVVPMPSEQYTLELTNTTVGRLDRQRSRVTGLVVGGTEIVLQDKNMLHTPSASKPTAGIHVVPPHHLGFSVTPGNSWVLEVGREYEITVHIFDKVNHRVIVTENVPLKTELPTDYLLSHLSSTNGSFHHVKAKRKGIASIKSSLSHMKHPDTGELHDLKVVVTKTQTLEIYDPVLVSPKQVVLLWDPQIEYNYQQTLEATGGSGKYQWSCDPEDVVGVSNFGSVVAIKKGASLVTAADKKNTAHFDTTEVFVVPPSEMTFLPSKVEATIGHTLQLPLQVKGYAFSRESPGKKTSLLPFSDCRKMKVILSTTETSVFNVSVSPDLSTTDGACLVLHALATKPGHTRLTLSYRYGDINLEASITIAAYPPLIPVNPEVIAIVTLGSSKDFVFEGGPAPWILDRSKYYDNLSTERPTGVSSYQKPPLQVGRSQHVYRVVCRELGEQTLTISIGNGATLKNQFPSSETASAKISCSLPVSMVMRPVVVEMPNCPLYDQASSHNIQFPVRNGHPLDIEMIVYDAESRPFDNFTSLLWRWTSTDQKLLPTPQITFLAHQEGKAIMAVLLSHHSGPVVVSAASNSHHGNILAAEHIRFKDPFSPAVNFSLSLLLRQEPELAPPTLLLFNHPNNKAVVSINHGSGHFQLDHVTRTRPPADTVYNSDSHHITVTPFVDGEMKVKVIDLCLEVGRDPILVVRVAGVSSISLVVADKVQVGNSTLAFVRLLDSQQNPFPASQFNYMKLQPNPKTPHIKVTPASNDIISKLRPDQTSHSAVFVVHGVTVGTTHLMFNATTVGGKVISSWPSEIQVFDALKLSPEYVTLLPTALFQIRSSGGPMPQSTIVFSISNATVATVDDGGLIEAITPGTAMVTGQAQATDPATGHLITYSQDTVYVRVVKLRGIKIFVPSTHLLSGVEVNIYAYGIEDETPFSFSSAKPGISFHWSASNMDVLTLASDYDKAGVSLQEEQDFGAFLRTRNPGQAIIRLTATCHPGACSPEEATFTDHVQVQVLPPLRLLRPSNGHFLLPHNGEARIITSQDGVSRLSYQLLQGSLLERQDLISVSPQGEIRTAAVNGHAVVMVTEHEEELGLNQTVLVHVEVRPVAALSIIPLTVAQATPNTKYHAFPLGYSAEFIVHLHDNMGRLFDFADLELSYRLNRYDIVRISPESGNATYVVKAAKEGDTTLKIWVKSLPHVSNYIRIRVGYAILPSLATVHLGSKICFTTHLTEDKPGWWTAGEEAIVSLQPDTGVGTAMSPGTTVIYHKILEVIDTHTEITVSKVSEVVFNVSSGVGTFTNAPRQEELGNYRVRVDFYHSGGDEEFSLIRLSPNRACAEEVGVASTDDVFIQQVPFECILEMKDRNRNTLPAAKFFTSQPYFDRKSGLSFCHLGGTNDPVAMETLAVMDGLFLSLTVQAFDVEGTYDVTSEVLAIPFVPAFSLNRQRIVLSKKERSTEVRVTGLPRQLQSLKVVSPYPVSAVKIADSVTTATYLISLISDKESFNDLVVSFSTSIAQQDSSLSVSYLAPGDIRLAPPSPSRSSTRQEHQVPPAKDLSATTTTSSPPPPPPTAPPQQPPVWMEAEEGVSEDVKTSIAVLLTVLAVVIATIVICLAVRQTSSQARGGFSAHLPRTPSQQAFPVQSPHASTTTATPGLSGMTGYQTPSFANQRTPPVPGQSGNQSAFRRPGFSPSPQHTLFSQ